MLFKAEYDILSARVCGVVDGLQPVGLQAGHFSFEGSHHESADRFQPRTV